MYFPTLDTIHTETHWFGESNGRMHKYIDEEKKKKKKNDEQCAS